ncbi:MAG: MATE family efflux transporter [Clostridia bacterium]
MLKKNYNLLDENIFVIFKKFVITSTSGMIMISLYILFDTIFIGQGIGQAGLAALNISIPIYNILFGTGILIGSGSATIMAISLGNKDMKGAQRAYEHSVCLGIITGIVYTFSGLMFIDQIAIFLGASTENMQLVKEYLGIIVSFSWSFVMVYNLAAVVRNDNGPKRAMLAMGIGGITNVIFDYILIFPLEMGMKGAAIATVMSSLVSLVILVWHFIGKHSSLKIKSMKLQQKLAGKILTIGMSSFIIEVSSGIVIFLFNKELLKTLGDIGVSAYSIIANVALMVTAIFSGIAQGVQPIASMNFGARKLDRVYKVRRYGIISAIALGVIFMLIGLIFPKAIIAAFTGEGGKIVDITEEGIKVYFLAFPIIGVNIVVTGFFQSIGQARYAMVFSLLRGIIFAAVGLKILSNMFGTIGIWLTIPVIETLTLVIITGTFLINKTRWNFYS